MKKSSQLKTLILTCSIFAYTVYAQNDSFYATMSLVDAKKMRKEHPNEIDILEKRGNEAAVLLTRQGGHLLHDNILVHGPGYIFANTKEDALNAIAKKTVTGKKNLVSFSISERAAVEKAIDLVNAQNIKAHILQLENYGTRYHTKAIANQCGIELKEKWENLAAQYNRNDVSVRIVEHVNTPMRSVVMTIRGSVEPNKYVIAGGHLDSTSFESKDYAPGADDDASGIATITEATRVLFESGFYPEKTIEIMAYAAEEIGLVGSGEIANDYKTKGIDVIAVAQFDMTNFNGSTEDIYFIEDNTDSSLNSFMKELINTYNTEGEHKLSYATSLCNYGCSDHASWFREGFKTTFPFEASFNNSNQAIHSSNDRFDISKTADHAAKFSKLCAEYFIEVAKNDKSLSGTLSVNDFKSNGYSILVKNKVLNYELGTNKNAIKNINITSVDGKVILSKSNVKTSGNLSLKNLNTGVYIITLEGNGNQLNQKIIL